jgi:hypothetical protein
MLPLIFAYNPTFVHYASRHLLYARHQAELGNAERALEIVESILAPPDGTSDHGDSAAYQQLAHACAVLVDSLTLTGWLTTDYRQMAHRMLDISVQLAVAAHRSNLAQARNLYRANIAMRMPPALSIFSLAQRQPPSSSNSSSAQTTATTTTTTATGVKVSTPKRRRTSVSRGSAVSANSAVSSDYHTSLTQD